MMKVQSALQQMVNDWQGRLDKAVKDENWADAAHHETYLNGLLQAKSLVDLYVSMYSPAAFPEVTE